MKKYILYFAMIYQSLSNIIYIIKMMYMVACFKKLWNSDLKQDWLDYCLINLLEKQTSS